MSSIKKMLATGAPLQRQGSIGYFGYGCPNEQLALAQEDLVAIMRDPKEHMTVRADAASSLCGLGEAAYPYLNDLLQLVMADKPDDKLGRTDEQLGNGINTLCKDPYAAGLVKDKKLFYAVAHKLMDHKRANGRIAGTTMIVNVPLEDFHHVADKVQYIIDDKDLTYHSYHNLGPKNLCISILANLNIQGGIESAFDTLEDPNGKAGFKLRLIMDVLPKYGANAKYALPRIKAVKAGKFQKQWDAMVDKIESAPSTTHKMITMEEAKNYDQDNKDLNK